MQELEPGPLTMPRDVMQNPWACTRVPTEPLNFYTYHRGIAQETFRITHGLKKSFDKIKMCEQNLDPAKDKFAPDQGALFVFLPAERHSDERPDSGNTRQLSDALPTSVVSAAPRSHRQLRDVHVTLFCPCSRPSTADATTQMVGYIGAAVQPALNCLERERADSASVQLHAVRDELPAIYDPADWLWLQVSKQLTADPPCRSDLVRADCHLRLESRCRRGERKQRWNAWRENHRSACGVPGLWRSLHQLEREAQQLR
ncbi:uncharacterized protein LOC144123434 [Amblyomma americanum]